MGVKMVSLFRSRCGEGGERYVMGLGVFEREREREKGLLLSIASSRRFKNRLFEGSA